MSVANMEFHVTGSIVKTTDPMNIYMENIYADTYDTISGFSFITNCNYPEANLIPTIFFNNITVFVSNSEVKVNFRNSFFFYTGPGNVTATNWNITNVFHLIALGAGNCYFSVTTECNPDDGLIKTFDIHDVITGVPFNDGSRTNVMTIEVDHSSARKNLMNVTGILASNFIGGGYGAFAIDSGPNDVAYFADSYFGAYSTVFSQLFFLNLGKLNDLIILSYL